MLVRALRFQYRPVVAHLIPIRRCNLSCAYCNEYDDHSRPVPTPDVFRRVDRLAALGTGIVTLSGGEPLLHPDLDEIIRRIRVQGLIATLITNGSLLSRERIGRLNRAGLDRRPFRGHGRTTTLRFSIKVIVRITAKAKITMPPARMLASRQRDAST